ncbi:hypothetical protein J6590_053506 [Homalodisca vitripennis]|nr:hypothetical protein J6590_053506 [Homalodisca vitripennis]
MLLGCSSKVPAFLNVVDIAGLVKGAAEGQGLGNAFLSHIKALITIFKWKGEARGRRDEGLHEALGRHATTQHLLTHHLTLNGLLPAVWLWELRDFCWIRIHSFWPDVRKWFVIFLQFGTLLLGWVTTERSCPCKQPICQAIGCGSEVTFKLHLNACKKLAASISVIVLRGGPNAVLIHKARYTSFHSSSAGPLVAGSVIMSPQLKAILTGAFDDDDVTHVEGEVNPVRDLEIIMDELRLKDMEYVATNLEKLERTVVRGNDKKLKPEYDFMVKVKHILDDEKKQLRFSDWNAVEIEMLNKHMFLTTKPGIYLVNLSEKDYIRKKNKWLIKIKEWVDKNDAGAILIPFSGIFENKLIDMDPAEKTKYLEDNNTTR